LVICKFSQPYGHVVYRVVIKAAISMKDDRMDLSE